jgi:hypothetical protein
MGFIQRFMSIIASLLLGFTAVASAGPVESAMIAALVGPEHKKLKIFDHEFNVKPISEIDSIAETTYISGQISHHLSWRRDDQVYYTIVKENGVVTSIDRKINRGGWAPILAPIVSAVGGYFGVPIPPEQVEEVGRLLGNLVDGSWESVADYLIAQIALRVDNGTEVDIDRPGYDYWSFDLPQADPNWCKTACEDDPACKAWAYVHPGVQADVARCWLKDTVAVSEPNTCCISGVMRLLPQETPE